MSLERRLRRKRPRRGDQERRIAAVVRRLRRQGAFTADPAALDGHVRAVLDGAPVAGLWRGLLVLALTADHHLRRTNGTGLPDDTAIAVPWAALYASFLGWCRFAMPLRGDPPRLTLGQAFGVEPAPALWGRSTCEPELASPPDAIAEDAGELYERQGWTAGPEHLARELNTCYGRAQSAAKEGLGASFLALEAMMYIAAVPLHPAANPEVRAPIPAPTTIVHPPWWAVRDAGGAFLGYVHGLLREGERQTLGQAFHVEAPPTGKRGRRPDTLYKRERREGWRGHLAVLVANRIPDSGGKVYDAIDVIAKSYAPTKRSDKVRRGASERSIDEAFRSYGVAAEVALREPQEPRNKR